MAGGRRSHTSAANGTVCNSSRGYQSAAFNRLQFQPIVHLLSFSF
jgi:hypothetical protein